MQAPNDKTSGILNAMTVDVEDYFQVSAFSKSIAREDWDNWPHRVEANTQKFLDLFDEADCKATFFTLGWVAEKYPALIRTIVDNGHELACHGFEHIKADTQTPTQFREDITRTKDILEQTGSTRVTGYRAASFSISDRNLWAFAELEAAGFEYSSSVYPIAHDHYGMPTAPRKPWRPEGSQNLLEIPITTVRRFGRNWPAGGGGYFRLFPYRLSRAFINDVNSNDQLSAIFYTHPWEIDPGQPRPDGLSAMTRFRHYVNQDRLAGRIRKLLQDFSWAPMRDVFEREISGTVLSEAN